MLSKNKIKFINSIKKKKYREIHRCFFVEGEKLVDELINYDVQTLELFATVEWIEKNQSLLEKEKDTELTEITENELKKISSLSTPNKVLAIAEQPGHIFNLKEIQSELNLFLDHINDPGNLGTIIRIADWFGIKNVFCSHESVDLFNPKVVQSSMGAIYRTKVHYVVSEEFLANCRQLENFKIYGTFLEGNSIYEEKLNTNGLILMGNESHGISESLKAFVDTKLFIPNFAKRSASSESLNISAATAIVCSEFRRRV